VFVDVTSVRESALVLCALARALGLLDSGGQPILARLEDVLAERRQLMVLDNFEQVLPAAAQLADLLNTCPGLALLVTSRVPLGLRWEQTLRLAPLPVPDLRAALTLDALLAIPSVELFVSRARARRADFVLSERHAPVVAQVAVELDGLPLALELAAARLDVLSLPTLARRLNDRLRLLAAAAPDRPQRQQSLEAAIGWSYDLLSEPERRLFRCLGVFVCRVTLDAIAAVTRAVAGRSGGADARRTLERLLSLAEQSLILPSRSTKLDWQQQNGDGDTHEDLDADADLAFDVLETVRAYAAERLAEAGELATAHRAHAGYFLALAERADPLLRGRDQQVWFLRLEHEHDNLQAALRWLLDQEDDTAREQALRLAGALGWFWVVRGYHTEGEHWLAEALARAPKGEAIDPAAYNLAVLAAGVLMAHQGDVTQARATLEKALGLARQRQHAAAIVQALTFLGASAMYAGGEPDTPLLREALGRARELGEPHQVGTALLLLGAAAQAQGDTAAAGAYYTEALGPLEAAGDMRAAAGGHFGLGMILGQQGDLSDALPHLRAGLEASVRLVDRWPLSYGLRAVLAVVGDEGNPVERARLLGAADALRQATGAGRAPWKFEQIVEDWSAAARRTRLTEAEWEAAYREGRTLSLADVATLAVRLLEEVAQALPQQAVVPDGAQSPEQTSQQPSLLTEREREVLRLVAQGCSNKAIARQLFLSPSTVNHHLTSVFTKLGVNTRAQAVAEAAQRGLW
jgi:non-specific serine/threonine protein kinase